MKKTASDLHTLFLESTGVTTDSRNCPEGSMFFALKGSNFNGNAFARQALEKGCSWAVVDEQEYLDEQEPRILLVDNVLESLQKMAAIHKEHIGIPVIGITGTNGKTTTKELLSAVLSTTYNVLFTKGNLNNQIGVPLTMLRLKKEHEVAIIEMGASHPGDIDELTAIAQPDMGLITNVGKAHLLGFGSFEGVIKTKGELYDYIREKGMRRIFIDNDNPYLAEISSGLDKITYGTTDEAFIKGWIRSCAPNLCVSWKIKGREKVYDIDTKLIGSYNLQNVLAAVCVGTYMGVSPDDIVRAIEGYQPTNSRSELRKTDLNTLIVDAYNANPSSMKASIENFHVMNMPEKMLILGGMRELGDESVKEHEALIALLRQCGLEDVILVGAEFEAWKNDYKVFRDSDEVISYLKENPVKGKTILLKGSNSVRLSTLIPYL